MGDRDAVGGGWEIRVLKDSPETKDLRMWRLINAFGKVRQGILENRKIKKVRSKRECI
jgi:hypothetical protein